MRALLPEFAREHPQVLADPAPGLLLATQFQLPVYLAGAVAIALAAAAVFAQRVVR